MVTRKFWFDGRNRWFMLCVDGKPICVTAEPL